MSRHSLQPLPGRGSLYEIAIGWDRPLGTFFVIVFGAPDDEPGNNAVEELPPLLWEGTAPAALATPEATIALASPYAFIPEGLAAQLAADREAETTTVNKPLQSSALAAFWPKPKGR